MSNKLDFWKNLCHRLPAYITDTALYPSVFAAIDSVNILDLVLALDKNACQLYPVSLVPFIPVF